MTALIETLIHRKSQNRLTSPGPTENELKLAFRAACRAPDHARLRPWRFRVYGGDGLNNLADAFASAAIADDPQITAEKLKGLRHKPMRAPVVIIASAFLQIHPKVPEIEQLLSVGAASENLLLALDSLGYGAIWRTGGMAYNQHFARAIGLAGNEKIVGFIYTGKVDGERLQSAEADIDPFISYHYVG